MIRKISAALLLACLAWSGLKADEKSKQLLDALTAKIKAYNSYEVLYTVDLSSEPAQAEGRFVVSGDRYYSSVNDLEIFFNGQYRYTYDSNQEEVVIENPAPSGGDMFANPTRFFLFYDKDFNHTYRGTTQEGSRSLETIELTPKVPGSGYSSVRLLIDPATKLPTTIALTLNGMNEEAVIRIEKFTPNVTVTPAMFSFDRKKYPDVEVIDFR